MTSLSPSMRFAAGLAAAVLALLAPAAAHACRFPYYYEERAVFPRTDFAAILFENAAFVDIAVLQRAEPIDLDAWVRTARAADLAEVSDPVGRKAMTDLYAGKAGELRRQGAGRLVFRSLQRLKGEGPAEFSLFGFRARAGAGPQERSGAVTDRMSPRAVWSADKMFELSPDHLIILCGPRLEAKADQPYLIFRDASGRLLGPSIPVKDPVDDTEELRQGFVFAPVELSGDAWLEAVRAAAKPTP